MAVTRSGQVIRMTAAGDTVTGMLQIQAIHADDALTVKDGAGTVLFITRAPGMDLAFPARLQVDGIEFDAGTGELVVFLA